MLSWNIGDPITFKVLQWNTDTHQRNMVVHRGVVVPRTLTSMECNSDLVPRGGNYSPEVQFEGGTNSIPVALEHQGTVDTPDIAIAAGGVKRHKTSSSPSAGIKHSEVDQPSIYYKQAALGGPVTADGFPALTNLGSVNNNGTMYKMSWDVIGQEELQDKLNDA